MWNYLSLPFLVFQFFIAEMIIFICANPFFFTRNKYTKTIGMGLPKTNYILKGVLDLFFFIRKSLNGGKKMKGKKSPEREEESLPKCFFPRVDFPPTPHYLPLGLRG